jgi:cardiolipin synthase
LKGLRRARAASARREHRRQIQVHPAVVYGLLAVIALLLLLLWSVLNHQSFELETEHRSSLEDELLSIVALTRGSLIEGNAIEIGQDGEFFDRLLPDLAAATETIHIESYVWWTGEICHRVAEILARKAEEGVEVRLLIDWAGGKKLEPELETLMEDAGVAIARFHPPTPRALGRFNARTHRKIVVVDGRTGYVFGHGFADEWTGKGQDREHYRDTFARVRGPIVNQLQGVFFENWLEVTRKLPFGEQYFPTIQPEGDVEAHVASVSSTGDVSAIETLYYGVVAAATSEVLIQNPYFVVEGLGLKLFEQAIARGVEVKVMLPSVASTDNPIVQHASHRHFEELLVSGVEIYEYDRTLLHQKVIVVDRLWSTIGSANFDDRSFELNDEVQLGMVDPRIARILVDAWENDLRSARRIDLEQWRRRGWWHRVKDRLAYALNEQL